MASDMDWTEEAIARLGAFWRDGHSTAEIGRRMGISKNAVVGKRTASACQSARARSRVRAPTARRARPRRHGPAAWASRNRARPRTACPHSARRVLWRHLKHRPRAETLCCLSLPWPSRRSRLPPAPPSASHAAGPSATPAGPGSGSATPTRCLASLTAPSTPGSPTSNPRPRATPTKPRSPRRSRVGFADLHGTAAASTRRSGVG